MAGMNLACPGHDGVLLKAQQNLLDIDNYAVGSGGYDTAQTRCGLGESQYHQLRERP
jgi:hypothetical protein